MNITNQYIDAIVSINRLKKLLKLPESASAKSVSDKVELIIRGGSQENKLLRKKLEIMEIISKETDTSGVDSNFKNELAFNPILTILLIVFINIVFNYLR